MITAVAHNNDGKRILVLGLTHENITRLMKNQPIHVSAETHAGFPEDVVIYIMFGETERALVESLKSAIGDDTKVVGIPRSQSHPGIS